MAGAWPSTRPQKQPPAGGVRLQQWAISTLRLYHFSTASMQPFTPALCPEDRACCQGHQTPFVLKFLDSCQRLMKLISLTIKHFSLGFYVFSTSVITGCHKPSCLKQHAFILSRFGGSLTPVSLGSNQGISLTGGFGGRIHFKAFSSCWQIQVLKL